MSLTFQAVIAKLNEFWADRGCLVAQPYDTEKGAGTMSPHTFLRAIGPEPWAVAYVEPCRRPTDGRYGENPNRFQHYYQYQVLIKPSPDNIQDIYLDSLRVLGIKYLQDVEAINKIQWNENILYGDIFLQNEIEQCTYNFEASNPELLFSLFSLYEQEAKQLIDRSLVIPSLDYVLKCSHTFNLLDARGVIAVAERTRYIGRIRHLARQVAQLYLQQREALGFPLQTV